MTRAAIFAAIRAARPGQPGWQAPEIALLDGLLDQLNVPRDGAPVLTARVALELVHHEAIVQEAYKDSEGVWTWSVGITSASGIMVTGFKDNPQPLAECLAAYVNRLRQIYAPAVEKAFAETPLTEAQFAAALSFHFNTGAIARATWVGLFKAGKIAEARASFMQWRKPTSIISRREKECALFFDGEWAGDGTAMIFPVNKPSYQPAFSRGKRVDIRAAMAEALA